MKIYNGSLLDKGNKQYFWEYLLAKNDRTHFHDWCWKSVAVAELEAKQHEIGKHLTQLQEKHKNFSWKAIAFSKVKLRRLRRKTYESKYDTCDKNLPRRAQHNNFECK